MYKCHVETKQSSLREVIPVQLSVNFADRVFKDYTRPGLLQQLLCQKMSQVEGSKVIDSQCHLQAVYKQLWTQVEAQSERWWALLWGPKLTQMQVILKQQLW